MQKYAIKISDNTQIVTTLSDLFLILKYHINL
jgi:hypothetical protein